MTQTKDQTELKICNHCHQAKPLEAFSYRFRNVKGSKLKDFCKRCVADKSRVQRLNKIGGELQPIAPETLTIDGDDFTLSDPAYWPGFDKGGQPRPPIGCGSKHHLCPMYDHCNQSRRSGGPVACERVAVQVVGEIEIIW